jgi:hypothetical protein
MVSESSPLLDARHPIDGTPIEQNASGAPSYGSYIRDTFRVVTTHVAKFQVLYYIAIFSFIVDVSFMMMIAPMARLTELGICRRHFLIADPSVIDPDGSIPEILCKIKPVQETLAKLSGVLTMLAMIPSKYHHFNLLHQSW